MKNTLETRLGVFFALTLIAADRIHPILALLLGFAIGTATGAVVWALVRIWPLIRLIWWWTPEISLALGIVYGWTALARARRRGQPPPADVGTGPSRYEIGYTSIE